MSKIPVNTFIKLWEEIKKREWLTDHKFAERISIEPSTITFWKNGRTKNVQPDIIQRIEKEFNYKIELSDEGKWKIQKLVPNVPTNIASEPEIHYYAPSGVSDEVAERYNEALRKVQNVDADNLEMVIQVLEMAAKKKKEK